MQDLTSDMVQMNDIARQHSLNTLDMAAVSTGQSQQPV